MDVQRCKFNFLRWFFKSAKLPAIGRLEVRLECFGILLFRSWITFISAKFAKSAIIILLRAFIRQMPVPPAIITWVGTGLDAQRRARSRESMSLDTSIGGVLLNSLPPNGAISQLFSEELHRLSFTASIFFISMEQRKQVVLSSQVCYAIPDQSAALMGDVEAQRVRSC